MKTVTNIMTVHQITYTIYNQSALIFSKKKLIILMILMFQCRLRKIIMGRKYRC